ncbi:phospholysine phosphohistidine inorganic pyrophosphate phosphatase isoform X3 [Octopus bimaculoides]|uniref:Phospholysine phosphohistidine inorganic pyrophosphate phosphatase n=1 Tax=Octopus bimaculoides TaxID=37653 RepID=A0A0L8GPB5_OCTBM|nr:phospholysine phosphohistidine inorganic pyrophosphate phosphatase isoform X3 [Octopus bimaculoides]|eukprot:XP_014779237.1 PREDICTED: phospholysine phosphohistidine inorganic pyrophosphate phosphatase-like isoform X3 [Octopus bimaculoides]
MAATCSSVGYWTNVKGLLLDITGVLYESTESGGCAIEGSVEAIQRLKNSGIAVRFCTNENAVTQKVLSEKLRKFGFNIECSQIFSPIPAVCSVLGSRGLRPLLLVNPKAAEDFRDIDTSNPNSVIIGDMAEHFTYEVMNEAFQLLKSLSHPVLLALGSSKYYQENGKLVLDSGAYMKVLESACDIEAEVFGKPSPEFFKTALKDMNLKPAEVVMIGDDIVNDIGGAQAVGLRGVQVCTGKFRLEDKNHATVKPDGFAKNLAEAVDRILSNN